MRQQTKHQASATARKVLQWFCPEELFESVEGDLLEQFDMDVNHVGVRKAKWKFVWNVIRFFRPGIVLRSKFSIELNQLYMLKNYMKVMLRSLVKRKAYAAINIFGLTIGLTFSMLIGVFVWQELQVNKQLKDVDRLYIIEQEQTSTKAADFMAPAELAKTMIDQYPSTVSDYYRFWDRNVKISKDDKHFIIQSIVGDSTLFSMFGFPVLYGDITSALDKPYSMVITEKVALQYFNRVDVVGESLMLSSGTEDKREFIVTAVVPKLERNSVSDLVGIDAQIFLSFQNWADFRLPEPKGWGQTMVSYLKLAPGISSAEVEKLMGEMISKHAPNEIKHNLKLKLAGLDDYYLLTNNGASKKMVAILSGVAAFILILAIINFVNISIGSATVRLKEIGVRKVIGGLRKHLVFQFLLESIILTFVAGIVAVIFYELFRHTFEGLFSTTLLSVLDLEITFWNWSLALLIVIGIMAGAYPAFFMSSYNAIESLKGKLKSSRAIIPLPKVLVTLQYLVAITIFTCAIAITEQVGYFLKKDLGYDKSFVLTVSSVPRIWSEAGINQMNSAKKMFLNSSVVESATLSWEVPNGNSAGDANIYKDGSEMEKSVSMPLLKTDEEYAKVYGLKLLDGKYFISDGESWQPNILVINEKAQKALNVNVGDKVRMPWAGDTRFTICGIVKDFHFTSLREEVKPLAILHTRELNVFRFFSFRLKPGEVGAAVEEVQAIWKKAFPEDPFIFDFMDQQLERLYRTEIQLKKASTVATVLMLVIVLTGIIGVVSLSVSRRIKEIGIRKVLGASVTSILSLISKEYLRLSIVAFALAVPLAYFFISDWLNGFSYRIQMSWWMFLLPGVTIISITVLVVSWQSLKSALLNPTRTLKYE
jgi:putative ABC transport system permease protein